MLPIRTAFVMEQALGHITHYRNLREFTDQQPDIAPVWLPIPFDVRGSARLVPLLRDTWSVRASWRARRGLQQVMRSGKDPLHALVFHTQVTALFSIGMIRQIPTLISMDATPINYDSLGVYYGHRPAGGSFLDRQKFALNQKAFQAAAGLVAWSDWARQSLISDYHIDADRVHVIPPGASAAYFEVGRKRASAAAHDSRSGPVQILFVGGDFERKGGPALVESMRGQLGQRCELHLVTQSDVTEQPNVFVHRGLQANSPELLRLFAAADIFVLPTRADCLGVVLMEAAAAALPVITTSVGALREAIVPGQSGLLIPPEDGQALEAALTTLVDDPERRQSMSRAGYALANARFHASHNNRVLLDLIGEMVHARAAYAC